MNTTPEGTTSQTKRSLLESQGSGKRAEDAKVQAIDKIQNGLKEDISRMTRQNADHSAPQLMALRKKIKLVNRIKRRETT